MTVDSLVPVGGAHQCALFFFGPYCIRCSILINTMNVAKLAFYYNWIIKSHIESIILQLSIDYIWSDICFLMVKNAFIEFLKSFKWQFGYNNAAEKDGHRKIQCFHKVKATRHSTCNMFVCAITLYSAKTLKGSTTNRFFILYITRSLLQTCSTSVKWQTSKLRTQHSQHQNSLLASASCIHLFTSYLMRPIPIFPLNTKFSSSLGPRLWSP